MTTRKTTYTATDANGNVHTRKSHRVYTHTVVVQNGRDVAIDYAKRAQATDRRDAEYYFGIVARGEEAFIAEGLGRHASLGRAYFAKEYARSVERAAEMGSPDQYVATRYAERHATIEATDWTLWHNVGWCGRFDLAQKLAAQQTGRVAIAILEAKVEGA
jgi:hypothetical protein